MDKIVKLYPDKDDNLEFPDVECTVCKTAFSPEDEGGIMGKFGMIPVQFCPFCLSSTVSMIEFLQEKKDEEDN